MSRHFASSPAVKQLIHRRAPIDELRAQAMLEGMRSLKQDGIDKALLGMVTLEQVRAVCN